MMSAFRLVTPRARGVRPVLNLADLSDEELATLAAREGSDGPAFVELLARYRERVWRICYRLLDHADDAQDAAQEVFVRLFTERARFEGRSQYATWVHGIAVRTCLMFRRGRGRRKQHEAAAAEQATHNRHSAAPTLSLEVREMLEQLDEEDRALVILKYCENYSYEELADMFGLSVPACKMRVSRAKNKLQQGFSEGSKLRHESRRSPK